VAEEVCETSLWRQTRKVSLMHRWKRDLRRSKPGELGAAPSQAGGPRVPGSEPRCGVPWAAGGQDAMLRAGRRQTGVSQCWSAVHVPPRALVIPVCSALERRQGDFWSLLTGSWCIQQLREGEGDKCDPGKSLAVFAREKKCWIMFSLPYKD